MTEEQLKIIEVERKLDGVKLTPISDEDGKDLFTLDEFEGYAKAHFLIDSDGTGYYATKTSYSSKYADPSEFVAGNIDRTWTHVIWFNK